MSVIDEALRRAEEEGVRGVRTVAATDTVKTFPKPGPVRNTDVPQAWAISERNSRPEGGPVPRSLLVLLLVALGVGGGWVFREEIRDLPMTVTQGAASSTGPVRFAASPAGNALLPVSKHHASGDGKVAPELRDSGSPATQPPPRPVVQSQPAVEHAKAKTPPPKLTAKETRRFHLGGVMLGGNVRLAVINGTIVEKGQRIDGAVVVSVGRRSAVLEMYGQRFRVPLSVAPR